MRCPFCDSDDTELLSPWGGQIITSQFRCRRCASYFEAVREDFEGAADSARKGNAERNSA